MSTASSLTDEDYTAGARADIEKRAAALEKVPSGAAAGSMGDEDAALAGNDYLVSFDGDDDPDCPLNWSFTRKCFTTFLYAACTFGPQFSSSVYGPTVDEISEKYNVGQEVATLGVSLFILGVGFGPMLFAPVSEAFGRKIGCLVPFFISGLFAIGAATASNIETVIIMRFFQGLFGGAPVSNSGGVLGDIWRPAARATALVFYAFVVGGSTTTSPIVGAALDTTGPDGWRWSQYLCGIYAFVVSIAAGIFVKETYHPVILAQKAKRLRLTTRNWAYHAQHDEWEFTFEEILTKHLRRPFAMLGTPIVICMCTYAAFAFGILYFGTIAMPIAFEDLRGWSPLLARLPGIGLFLGIVFGGCSIIYAGRRYTAAVVANGGKAVPEERLIVMRYTTFCMPVGLFIFGWTADAKYPWIAPVIGITIMSIGFFTVFQGCLNYLVDSFSTYAASAIATTTFTRSCFAAAFPLFGRIMFNNLTVPWGASLLGFVSLGMVPIPFLFYKYGPYIRSKNPYSMHMS
ncbi:major facilitator superfamily domain-containing protein [Limtongia smithiae]|uniref:major facilitator superfamily domain-containing protein n=1 Tax=Limtongia smithiae TaxID=1125753 RepID=UPI0034CD7F19